MAMTCGGERVGVVSSDELAASELSDLVRVLLMVVHERLGQRGKRCHGDLGAWATW